MPEGKRLDELTPQQLKAVKASVLTEHFGWAPEEFAKQGMDLANVSMYAATEVIEKSLLEKTKPPNNLDEDEIQKGIYRLETLLESAIDRHFDLYEIYVLRNTFQIPTDLIPYMVLKHQEHIDESLRDTDSAALEEYETELGLYEEELKKERELECASEYVQGKVEEARERANQVGYMSAAEPLSSRTQGVVSQLSLLHDRVAALLDTPTPRPRTVIPDPADPWGNSRSTFVNFSAIAKVDTLPTSGGAPDASRSAPDDAAMRAIGDTIATTGSNRDAQALIESLRSV